MRVRGATAVDAEALASLTGQFGHPADVPTILRRLAQVERGAMPLAATEAWTCEQGFASVRVRSNVLRERAHRFCLREGCIEKKRQAVFLKRLHATNART